MRKINKILVGIFIAGVIISGIGTGIAIVEYSSLEYTGVHILGQEDMKTKKFDIEVVTSDSKKVRVNNWYNSNKISYDESVPNNIVRYEVTYNSKAVNPDICYREYDAADSEYQGVIDFYTNSYYNEFDLFMRNKDNILKELKDNKIGTYQTEYVKDIKISVNPQMKEYVSID